MMIRFTGEVFSPTFWYLISAGLFVLAYSFPVFWWCGILALVTYIRATSLSASYREVIYGSLIVGSLKMASAMTWVWYTYPLPSRLISDAGGQLAVIGIYWLVNSILIGSSFVILGIVFFIILRYRKFTLWLFPILLVMSEVVGSLIVSLYQLGPTVGLNINFSFGYVGYLLANSSVLLPLSYYLGVYGLTLVAGFMSVLIYLIITPSTLQRKMVIGGVGISFIVFLYIYAVLQISHQPISRAVIAVETKFDHEFFEREYSYAEKQKYVQQAVVAAIKYQPEAIVLPEDSRFVRGFSSSQTALAWLTEITEGRKVMLVDSSRITDSEGKVTLRTFVFDTENQIVHRADKRNLTPQGEYIPYLVSGGLRLFGNDDAAKKLEAYYNYETDAGRFSAAARKFIPAIMFCYESLIPYHARLSQIERQTDWIAHPVSHTWFHDPVNLWQDLEKMLEIQAIWSDTIILQAGNVSASKKFGSDGTVDYGTVLEEHAFWNLVMFNL